MVLDARASLPSARSYVVKLHRDALPQQGQLRGRLKHIASGDHVDFESADELLAWLTGHASSWNSEPEPG
jgi:hypothetical protein